MTDRFENLIIIGRPGSGKSEVVDLFRKIPLSKRIMNYYVGDFVEVDDFVLLNEKFKEDDIWAQTGVVRKYTKRTEGGYIVTNPNLWDFCLEMLDVQIKETYLSDPKFYKKNTLFIEFSRGGDKNYRDSLGLFSDEILKKSSILHLDISYKEALKRNELRYIKGQEDTTLHHKVPLEQMEKSYSTSDWMELSFGRDEGLIQIRDINIPFVSIKNQPAPKDKQEFEERLMSAFHTLFSLKYGEKPWYSAAVDADPTKKQERGSTFDHLFVFGRPASGKSEFIDFIKKTNVEDRIKLFHASHIEELDDYKMLAQKFKEDDVWKKITGDAKYTTMEAETHVITDLTLYNFAANRINDIAIKRYIPNMAFYEHNTLLIEFSRGRQIGYEETLKLMDPEVLKRGAIFYIKTSFDECWRRNVARYEEKKALSVLAHMVPRDTMERMYRTDDWEKITNDQKSGSITINGVDVPFVTMDNENESKDPKVLTDRYKKCLDVLVENYKRPQVTPKTKTKKIDHFDNLFVFGRPAGGKSEFIDYMKKCEPHKRQSAFKVAPFEIIDDFLFLWELGENEELLEQLKLPKKITEKTEDGIVVTDGVFFDFVTQKINRIMGRKYLAKPEYYDKNTLLIEFSRGIDLSGYKRSLAGLKQEILSQGAIIYIKVSYEEALRRNEARYQEKLKHSVLAHKVPVKAMETFYVNDDWGMITDNRPNGFINIEGAEIPFVTMENEPESKDLSVMEKRYESALEILFELWKEKKR